VWVCVKSEKLDDVAVRGRTGVCGENLKLNLDHGLNTAQQVREHLVYHAISKGSSNTSQEVKASLL
jgi:hypothetical protein